MNTITEEIILEGRTLSKGIAIGSIYCLADISDATKNTTIKKQEIALEIEKYRKALRNSRNDLLRLQKLFSADRSKSIHEIIDAQIQILKDPCLTDAVEEQIRHLRKSSSFVFQSVITQYKKRFSQVRDDFFEERIKDIVDIYHRVSRYLQSSQTEEIKKIPSGFIVFAKEITPLQAVEALASQVQAFVTQEGSIASHSAIIARAKKIPFVAHVDLASVKDVKIEKIIVDGIKGYVIINPSSATLRKYQQMIQQLEEYFSHIEKEAALPAITQDGQKIFLYSNVELLSDVDQALEYDIEGIGIFRSEFLFLSDKVFPSEQMQYKIYTSIAKKMKGKPFVIRVFDVGGEKDYFYGDKEDEKLTVHEMNPILGCRGIRYLLRNEKILHAQLKAILRASCRGKVSLLLPMISDVDELREIKIRIEKIKEELATEDIFPPPLDIGVMIEVPASAFLMDYFLEEADFISIGTNDLTQYILAADRNNPFMSNLYNCAHPSILRALMLILSNAAVADKKIFFCGEMAANPKFIPLLIAMGFRHFSVASNNLSMVKHAIRKIDIPKAKLWLQEAQNIRTAKELQQFLLQKEI